MTPKYEVLYRGLRSDILKGRLRPGDLVPSQRKLARQKSVHVLTASRALDELARGGYVVREHGRGTFVAKPESFRPEGGASESPQRKTRSIGVILAKRH